MLEAFVAVADELHFSRAAIRLHLDQPALSRRVKKLEALWSVELFARSSRSVELTETGRALLAESKAVLATNTALSNSVATIRRRDNGAIRIGFMAHAFGPAVREVIRGFRADHPDVAFEFVEGNFTDPTAGIAASATDLAFVWLPFRSPGVSVRPLFEVPRLAVMAASHPLGSETVLQTSDLAGYTALVPDTTDELFLRFWSLGDLRHGPIVGRCKTPDECAVSLLTTTAISIGATTLDDPLPAGLVAIPMHDIAPAHVGLSWRPAGASAHVRELVQRCLRDLTALSLNRELLGR